MASAVSTLSRSASMRIKVGLRAPSGASVCARMKSFAIGLDQCHLHSVERGAPHHPYGLDQPHGPKSPRLTSTPDLLHHAPQHHDKTAAFQ